MSILPSHNQGSTSSSSSSQPNPNPNPSNHGSPRHSCSLHSLHISDSHLPPAPAPVAPPPEHTCGSSREVNEAGKLHGKNTYAHQKTGAHFQRDPSGRGGVGSAQHRWSPRSPQTSGSTSSQGSTPQSAGRKTQTVNGNHLLNFHYDPISRQQPRAPPTRRHHKRKPYNKDLFLQANYKFVMLDSGNCAPDSIDPDTTLRWEEIICVKYFTPVPVHCPICLEDLLCPQMTSCGHIFCFPCILRYFLMAESDHKGECWKKCPLCFMMISSKDLYTIYIESVKEHCVGDTIEFMLLTRQKDSFTLSLKSKQDDREELHDSFSKFTFTTDVDMSVRKAMSELDGWLARADSGLVDDLEKLPYVCAAMEQLEERKKYWNGHRVSYRSSSRKDTDFHSRSPPTASSSIGDNGTSAWGPISACVNHKPMWLGASRVNDSNGEVEPFLDQPADIVEVYDDQNKGLYDDNKNVEIQVNGPRDRKVKNSYDFYQAIDGQYQILHPLNMKCLLHHYGSYDKLPQRISGRILHLETVTQSEVMRRRYRYLSHFSLTTTFQLCEIDLSEILTPSALSPFMDEIKNREKQRERLARKEQEEKIKAEAASTAHFMSSTFDASQSSQSYSPVFSIDDFEALGTSAMTSSSPPNVGPLALGSSAVTSSNPPNVGERPLFSNVTRLGFAASPALRINEARAPDLSRDTSGLQNGGSTSFANIISRAKPVEPKIVEMGKKGKKPSRVLLSTTGGRRY